MCAAWCSTSAASSAVSSGRDRQPPTKLNPSRAVASSIAPRGRATRRTATHEPAIRDEHARQRVRARSAAGGSVCIARGQETAEQQQRHVAHELHERPRDAAHRGIGRQSQDAEHESERDREDPAEHGDAGGVRETDEDRANEAYPPASRRLERRRSRSSPAVSGSRSRARCRADRASWRCCGEPPDDDGRQPKRDALRRDGLAASPERWSVHQATVGPQRVQAASHAERRLRSEISIEDLAVVADLRDHVCRSSAGRGRSRR